MQLNPMALEEKLKVSFANNIRFSLQSKALKCESFGPCVLKVKVTSLSDSGVKVFIQAHRQHDSHFLPP